MRHWWLPFMLLAGALHAQSAPETGHWRGSARFFASVSLVSQIGPTTS